MHQRQMSSNVHMFRTCCFRLETREIIKISTHPCYPITDFYGDEAKKNPKFRLKKTEFFKTTNSQLSNSYRVARMGRNFDDYSGFQPKTTPV